MIKHFFFGVFMTIQVKTTFARLFVNAFFSVAYGFRRIVMQFLLPTECKIIGNLLCLSMGKGPHTKHMY